MMTKKRKKIKITITTIVWKFLILFLNFGISTCDELNLPLHSIIKFSDHFGQSVYDKVAKATAIMDLKIDYLLLEPNVKQVDGQSLTSDMKRAVQKMLHRKLIALHSLSNMSDVSFRQHIFDPTLRMTYPESKNLNYTDFILVRSAQFNDMTVNFTMSTVHIPNSVYEKSSDVLNGVAWSASLDDTFKRNNERDEHLKWQYFCSSTGFLRMYPGTTWQKVKSNQIYPNVYDCRLQKWYIQASTSPKVVIFLMDVGDGMKNKMELAKKTVKLFLDTLTDEDYFNVIFFSSTFNYAELCFNFSLLLASNENKNRVVTYIDNYKWFKSKTSYEDGVREALKLISTLNNSMYMNHVCERSLVMLTSMLTSNIQTLISDINRHPFFKVKPFIYLFGKDKSSRNLARDIACSNGGFHARIDSDEQIFEQLLNFITVLSNSSITSSREITWTNIYEDTAGLDLIFTIAKPVQVNKKFIGVVGVDVAIVEFERLFNSFQLGVDAYGFIITESGNVVYHPELKAKSKYKYEFSYNPSSHMVDLEDLEKIDVIKDIKEAMMRRETAYMNINSVGLFDNFKRVNMRRGNCFFTPIDHTSFSFGLVLPQQYGRVWVDGKRKLHEFDFSSWNSDQFTVAPWQYCSFDLKEKMDSRSETLYHQLKIAQTNSKIYTEKCNEELVMNLLYDIEATRGASNSWMKENWDSKHAQIRSDGVDMVYFGTKGGLTRYFVFNQTNQELFEDYLEQTAVSTSQSLYYKRAINGGEDVFTFSLPFLIESSMNNGDSSSSYPLQYQPPSHLYSANMDDILISASAPVVIHNDVSEGVVGVVGLLMRYSQFRQILNETSISLCRHGEHQPCVKTCESEVIECYLIDQNGYIVYSEDSAQLGYFLGELEGCAPRILKDLIIRNEEESNMERDPNQDGYHHHHHQANLGDAVKNSGIFNKIEVTDHQAVCEIIRKSSSNSEALSNNFSFTVLLNKLVWVLSEVYLFMSHIGSVGAFFGFKQTTNETTPTLPVSAFDEVPPDLETYRVLMTDLMKISSAEQAGKWKDNCMRQSGFNADVALACLRSIKKAYEPGILGFRPCIQSYTRYEREKVRLPQNGRINKKERDICTKPYLIADVPHTNLMLLATDTTCMCEDAPTVSSRPVEVVRDPAAMEGTCDKLTFDPNVQQLRPTTSSSVAPSLSSSTSKCSVRVQHEDGVSWNQDETSQSETGSHFCGDGVSIHVHRYRTTTCILLSFIINLINILCYVLHINLC